MQSLPTGLQQAVKQAYEAMHQEARHELLPFFRQAIYRAIASQEATNTDLVRGRLAILTAKHVLHLWEADRPDDPRPQRLLEFAESVMKGEVPDAVGKGEAEEAFEKAAEDYETLASEGLSMPGHTALAAAVEALFEASKTYRLRSDLEPGTTNQQLDPWSCDTALWAWAAVTDAYAYPDPAKPTAYEPEESRQFWEWWLLEAIPQALRLA